MKILVIDDSFIAREFTKKIIKFCCREDAPEIFEAANGAKALDLIKSESDMSLIICDINMPEMNGKEFIQTIKSDASLTSAPIIFITSLASDARVTELKNEGAYDVLAKPIQMEKLKGILIDLNIIKTNKASWSD